MHFTHNQQIPDDIAKQHGLIASEWRYCKYRGDFFRTVNTTGMTADEVEKAGFPEAAAEMRD